MPLSKPDWMTSEAFADLSRSSGETALESLSRRAEYPWCRYPDCGCDPSRANGYCSKPSPPADSVCGALCP